jgi:hypothetical protein
MYMGNQDQVLRGDIRADISNLLLQIYHFPNILLEHPVAHILLFKSLIQPSYVQRAFLKLI